jgi:hypothetical protein
MTALEASKSANAGADCFALRDGQDGNRFIVNIPGRGYCFVATVAMSAREN